MKGLLYKEFMLDLSTILVYGTVQAVLTVITLIMAYLSGGDVDALMVLMVMGFMLSFIIYFLFSMMPLTTFFSDASHAWQNFAASSPAGPAGQVGSKYLMMLICYVSAFIVHAFQFIAVSLITNENFYFMIIPDLFLLCGSLIITSFEYPFFFAFGAEKGQSVKMASAGVLFFIAAAYLLFGDVSFFGSPSPLAALLAYLTDSYVVFVFIGIMLAAMPVFCLSMTISVKLFPIGLENLEQ